jgi:hypothetical protein
MGPEPGKCKELFEFLGVTRTEVQLVGTNRVRDRTAAIREFRPRLQRTARYARLEVVGVAGAFGHFRRSFCSNGNERMRIRLMGME